MSLPPVRGLTGGYILSPAARALVVSCVFTPGSRTHRGLHSVARCAGSRSFLCSLPPVRGLTGGYILSPAARALVVSYVFTPGSRTHRGLHSVARCAGSRSFLCSLPPVRGLTGGYILSPAARALVVSCVLYRRFADSPGATFCRPLRGLS